MNGTKMYRKYKRIGLLLGLNFKRRLGGESLKPDP